MSPTTARLLLWGALLLALPLPWMLLEPVSGPVVRMLQLGAWLAAIAIAEGDRSASAPLAALALGQAGLWMAACWAAATVAVRALGHHRRLLLAVACMWSVGLGVGGVMIWPVFDGDVATAPGPLTLGGALQ